LDARVPSGGCICPDAGPKIRNDWLQLIRVSRGLC
jgi:hypothetical protein